MISPVGFLLLEEFSHEKSWRVDFISAFILIYVKIVYFIFYTYSPLSSYSFTYLDLMVS